MKRVFTTTLRLDLLDQEDRRAYERLRHLDRTRYRSYSKAVVAAVNDYFDRQERLATDPYLETREKEDAFLQRVMEAVGSGLRAAPSVQMPEAETTDEEDLSAALDFADSF